MKNIFRFSLLAIVTVFMSTAAHARNFRIGFVGAYGITNVQQSAGSGAASVTLGETDNSFNVGGGALVEFGLFGPMGLEVGALYQARGFKDVTSQDEVKFNALTYTAMFRFNFGESSGDLKLPLSLGLGGYYSESADSQVTEFDGTTKASSQKDFSDSTLPLGAMGKIDRGLLGSLAVEFPMSDNFTFTFDIRYLYGLTDVVAPQTGVTGNFTEISTVTGLVLKF